MKIRPWIALLLALGALSACGNAEEGAEELRNSVGAFAAGIGPPPPDARARITPEALAEVSTALFTERPGVAGAQSVMFRQARDRRGAETWQDTARGTVVLREGILVATRGFGGDLVSAEVSEVLAAVHGGAARAVRVHRALNAEEQLELRSYVCDYSRGTGAMTDPLLGARPARVVVENCIDSQGATFENRYWIDAGGVVRQSMQWIGPEIGMLTIVLLKG